MQSRPILHPRLKRMSSRASTLLMLAQRSPVAQLIFPEAKLLSGGGLAEMVKWSVATVAGLGVFDTVSAASTVSQVSPVPNASTVSATSGTALTFVYRYGGSDTPDHFEIIGTLPPGLVQTNSKKSKTDSISGIPTTAGTYPITVKAWRNAAQTQESVSKAFTITVTGGTTPVISGHPGSITINHGTGTTLGVTAGGTSPSYQWYLGTSGTSTSPVSGATLASYTTPVLTTTASYWVKVTSGGSSTNSNTAVVTVRTPFDSWRNNHSMTTGANDDDDHDGLKNILEYVLGLNPAQPNGGPAGSFAMDPIDPAFLIYTLQLNGQATDATASLQRSTSMSGIWTALPDNDPVYLVTRSPGQISVRIPKSAPRQFFRLSATIP